MHEVIFNKKVIEHDDIKTYFLAYLLDTDWLMSNSFLNLNWSNYLSGFLVPSKNHVSEITEHLKGKKNQLRVILLQIIVIESNSKKT
jgi:hypothetical protein